MVKRAPWPDSILALDFRKAFMKPFRDREDAARQLARALSPWRGRNAVVYAIPRGAMPMAALIAEELDAEVDVVLTHKLGAPGNPEFAIGALAESVWSHVQYQGMDVDDTYVRRETAAQLERLLERRRRYGAVRCGCRRPDASRSSLTTVWPPARR